LNGLIERDFIGYSSAIRNESMLLHEHGYNNAVLKVLDGIKAASGFGAMSKEQGVSELGNAVYNTFSSTMSFGVDNMMVDHHGTMRGLHLFDKQVELYGSEGELGIQAFDILKLVYKDGTERVNYDNSCFSSINDNLHLVVDFDKPSIAYRSRGCNDITVALRNADDILAHVNEFYIRLTRINMMEGVVIKPLNDEVCLTSNIAPCLKCRNTEYLRIIYGHDYDMGEKYDALIKNKSISKKVRLSISEFRLGHDMLNIPYGSLDGGDESQLVKVCKLIGEVESEKELDPRL